MINNFLSKKIKEKFQHEPTGQQNELINLLSAFIASGKEGIFLLKGFAGTGKTSIISALVKAMDELQQPVVLMAPTGRAAKVFSAYSSKAAFTIHKKIYRQKSAANFLGRLA